MKTFFFGLLFLVLVGVGGFFWLSRQSTVSQNQPAMTAAITRAGILQKSTVTGVDFTHSIVGDGQTWGVISQVLNLDDYVGKRVSATGQNSGTTLYIDTIIVLP